MKPQDLSQPARRTSLLFRLANLLVTLAVILVAPMAVGAAYAYLVVPRLADLAARGLDLPDVFIIYFLGLALLTGLVVGGLFAISLYQHLVAGRRRTFPRPPSAPPKGPAPEPP
jgi:hypothetical protein